MNAKEEKDLIQSTKKQIIGSLVAVLVSGVIGLTAFYFQTSYVTAQNTKEIVESKADLKELKKETKNITTVPLLNQSEIRNIKKQVEEVKDDVKEMRKEQQKVLELLYQIKRQNNN